MPEKKEFGAGGFEYRSSALSDDIDQAWERYVSAIDAALRGVSAEGETKATNSEAPATLPSLHVNPQESATTTDGPDGSPGARRGRWFRRLLG